jgi:hypothetical protein
LRTRRRDAAIFSIIPGRGVDVKEIRPPRKNYRDFFRISRVFLQLVPVAPEAPRKAGKTGGERSEESPRKKRKTAVERGNSTAALARSVDGSGESF